MVEAPEIFFDKSSNTVVTVSAKSNPRTLFCRLNYVESDTKTRMALSLKSTETNTLPNEGFIDSINMTMSHDFD
jgi:hypothetical protein